MHFRAFQCKHTPIKNGVTEKKNEAMVSSTHCTSVSAPLALATINGQADNKFAFFLFWPLQQQQGQQQRPQQQQLNL